MSENGMAAQRTVRTRRGATELRQSVLHVAAGAFEELGYTRTTTALIARRAATTEAQLFRYFSSKSALFREAILDPLNAHFEDFMIRAARDQDDRTMERQAAHYIAELQEFIWRHRRMFLSLVTMEAYGPDEKGGSGGVDALRTYFERGAARMRARTGDAGKLPPELMVRISFATVLACMIFQDWLLPAGVSPGSALRQTVTRFVIDGLYADEVPIA